MLHDLLSGSEKKMKKVGQGARLQTFRFIIHNRFKKSEYVDLVDKDEFGWINTINVFEITSWIVQWSRVYPLSSQIFIVPDHVFNPDSLEMCENRYSLLKL